MNFEQVTNNYSLALCDLFPQDNKRSSTKVFQEILDSFKNNSEIIFILNSNNLTKETRKKIVNEIFTNIDLNILNFFNVLIDNNHFFLVVEIINKFIKLTNDKNNVLTVTIESAFEINSNDLNQIVEFIRNKSNRSIDYKVLINPKLIGGVKIYYESSVIDYSISGKLKQLVSLSKERREL